MTKKIYENPTIQVIELRARDVMHTSDSGQYGMSQSIFDEEVQNAW